MKSKILTITALIAVMVAMIGIAAADDINVYEPGTSTPVVSVNLIPGGSAVVKDLKVFGFNKPKDTNHILTDTIAPLNGGNPADIIVKYHEKTAPCGPTGCVGFNAQPYTWVQDAGVGSSETLDVSFAAAAGVTPGKTYQVQITDNNGNPLTVSVTIEATAIPEFPTVALPIGAAIGLVFFFQHKKRKEE